MTHRPEEQRTWPAPLTDTPPFIKRSDAAAQGALDGGLDVPHSDKRFVGYSAEDKALDAETLRKYIYGGHVSEYMENLQARLA